MIQEPSQKSGRPSLLSVRVSAAERAQLVHAARGEPLSRFVRSRLFDRASDTDIARCLHALGASGLGTSLTSLAEACRTDRLVLDEKACADLLDTLAAVRALRRDLMKTLGLRPKEDS